MKKPLAALCCIALPALGGCSPSPAQPAPPAAIVATVPPPAPAPGPAPASMLGVSEFKVLLFRRAGSSFFQYELASLEVIETSGTHAATLIEVDVTTEGGRVDRDCPLPMAPIRIGPGERLDLVKAMGYCIPYAVTTSEVSAVTVIATFRDDLNGTGQLRKTVSVEGCTLAGTPGMVTCK